MQQGQLKNRRRLAWTVLLGSGVLLAASWLAWNPLRERWYLLQLNSDDVATQDRACFALGQLKSSVAIPRLLELLKERPGSAPLLTAPGEALCAIGEAAAEPVLEEWIASGACSAAWHFDYEEFERNPYSYALEAVLERLGATTVPALIRILEDGREDAADSIASLLDRVGPAARPALLPLFRCEFEKITDWVDELDTSQGGILIDLGNDAMRWNLLAEFPEEARKLVDGTKDFDGVTVVSRIHAHAFQRQRYQDHELAAFEAWSRSDSVRLRTLGALCWGSVLRSRSRESISPLQLSRISTYLSAAYRDLPLLRERILATCLSEPRIADSLLAESMRHLKVTDLDEKHAILAFFLRFAERARESKNATLSQGLLFEIAQLLTDEDPDTRVYAAEILCGMDVPAAIDRSLRRRIQDPNEAVRCRVALAFLQSPRYADDAKKRLLGILESGRDSTKRVILRSIRFGNGLQRSPRLIELLNALVNEGPMSTRRLAVGALVSLFEPEQAVQLVMNCARSDDPCWGYARSYFVNLLRPFAARRDVTMFLVDQIGTDDRFWSYPDSPACCLLARSGNPEVYDSQILQRLRSGEPRWVRARSALLRVLRKAKGQGEAVRFLCETLIAQDEEWRPHYEEIYSLLDETKSRDPILLKVSLAHLAEDRKRAERWVRSLLRRAPAVGWKALEPSSGLEPQEREFVFRNIKPAWGSGLSEGAAVSLLRCFDDPKIARTAASELAFWQEGSRGRIDAILAGSKHSNREVRNALKKAAISIEDENEEYVLQLLRSGSVEMQRLILERLDWNFVERGKVVLELQRFVESSNATLAALASVRLTNRTRLTHRVPLDVLLPALSGAPDATIDHLLGALSLHSARTARVSEAWLSLLTSGDPTRRLKVLEFLVLVSDPSDALVLAAAELLSDSNCRGEVYDLLKRWGRRRARLAIPKLFSLCKSRETRSDAIALLVRLAPERSEIEPLVLEEIRKGGEDCENIFWSLPFPQYLNDQDVQPKDVVEVYARVYLQDARGKVPEIPEAVRRIRSASYDAQRLFLYMLARFWPREPEAVAILIGALHEYSLRDQAARFLGDFGPAAKAALPHLMKLLRGRALESFDPELDNGDTDCTAAQAIRKIRGES
ncbi:MAG: HEAT repeat domain-containing protein [Planctomycetota bacterium]